MQGGFENVPWSWRTFQLTDLHALLHLWACSVYYLYYICIYVLYVLYSVWYTLCRLQCVVWTSKQIKKKYYPRGWLDKNYLIITYHGTNQSRNLFWNFKNCKPCKNKIGATFILNQVVPHNPLLEKGSTIL